MAYKNVIQMTEDIIHLVIDDHLKCFLLNKYFANEYFSLFSYPLKVVNLKKWRFIDDFSKKDNVLVVYMHIDSRLRVYFRFKCKIFMD